MDRLLIVKLSSLGDIVHTLPLAGALRASFPNAQIDWLVDRRFGELVRLVQAIDTRIEIDSMTLKGLRNSRPVVARLRETGYDCALDAQGLMKSALFARLSGAARVIGFTSPHLRERSASMFYTEQIDPGPYSHVIDRNLGLLRSLGAVSGSWLFPIGDQPALLPPMKALIGIESPSFGVLFPGATWLHKRWPPDRFGRLAQSIFGSHGIRSAVLTPPGEESLSLQVAATSEGAATATPGVTLENAIEMFRNASFVVSADSGPLHIASAVGAPVIALHGPTDPVRNGPWSPDDEVVSRFSQCQCRYRRRCSAKERCMNSITVEEVLDAVGRRMAKEKKRKGGG